MSDDGKYLLITINEGKKRSMNYIDLEVHDEITEKMPLTKIESFGHGFTVISTKKKNSLFSNHDILHDILIDFSILQALDQI